MTPEQLIAADLGLDTNDLHRIVRHERAKRNATQLADMLHELHGQLNTAAEILERRGETAGHTERREILHRACRLIAKVEGGSTRSMTDAA